MTALKVLIALCLVSFIGGYLKQYFLIRALTQAGLEEFSGPHFTNPNRPPEPRFSAGGLDCRKPSADGSALSAGEACWCLFGVVRNDIGQNYASEKEGFVRYRDARGLCLGRQWAAGAAEAAYSVMYPYGLSILKEAIAEAREVNPRLFRTGPMPPVPPGGQRAMIREAQNILAFHEFGPGPVDGRLGPRTDAALRAFQSEAGIEATGRLDAEMLGFLRNSVLLPSDFPLS
jgi:hypothetical protein